MSPSFFANIAAATNTALLQENKKGEKLHVLTTLANLNPESLSAFPQRLAMNRHSAYSPPKWALGVLNGLPSFNTSQCSLGLTAALDPTTAESPAFQESTQRPPESEAKKEAEDFFKRLQKYAFAEQTSTSAVPTPACKQQAPLKAIYGGESSTYQHTFEQTGP